VQQTKQDRRCPNCGGPLKRTIGAQTRMKFWECVNKGIGCFRKEASAFGEQTVSLDVKWDTKDVQA
jgi:ssDNA-binding Zn-finger/Zn-ribbon topoisomerase 1